MKKLLIVALAAMMCLCFVLPATAEIKLSGGVWADFYVRSFDKFAMAALNNVPATGPTPTTDFTGRSDLQFNSPTGLSYINFAYTSAKADYGALLSFSMGEINHMDNSKDLQGNYAYMWWKVAPMATVRLGFIDQFIGGLYPSTWIGNSEYYRFERADSGQMQPLPIRGRNFVPVMITFGNLHSSARMGADLAYTINDMVTLKIGLYDPDVDGSDLNSGATQLLGTNGFQAYSDSKLPRIDVGLPVRIGNFYFQPKGGWLRTSFNDVGLNALGNSQDDSFDTWVVGIDASVTLGPITLSGEYIYGQNLGGTNYTVSSYSFAPYTYLDGPTGTTGNTKISETDDQAWWFQIAWAATPKIMLYGNYGQFKSTDDRNPFIITDDRLWKREAYGVSLRYAIAPNFFVVPAWTHAETMDDTYVAGPDYHYLTGAIDMYGVSFFMLF